jgi:biotin transport system substrate-specific component
MKMTRSAANSLTWDSSSRSLYWAKQAAVVVSASLFVALCARVTIPLPFTPVPLTLQNFGVLLVGLTLGARRGFVAMALYLIEGVSGLPVFNPTGPGGIAQLVGPTGGFLMAYPLVAGVAGLILNTGKPTFARAALSGLLAEIVLFASGIGWLIIFTLSVSQAVRFGFYWFISAEIIKVMFAAAIAVRIRRTLKAQT